ncbi:MAG: ATP-dependent DNA helicase RecQ [bacterium]|nr:ATP-dependent DNA helicase RecQ [bacterium]
MQNKPLIILNDYFKHNEFRGNQEKIINRILNEKDGHSLVIMPTGAGKSLCYQIPALCLEGGTLVISPLIALMQDQVDSLRKLNIKADFINSTVSKEKKTKRLNNFVNGKTKLLYVTPERFKKQDFCSKIVKANISLLAIDEAHCISSWGHDFRPDYSRIFEFRKLIGNPVTIALTATATKVVQNDIIKRIGLMPDEMKIFHQGIKRPNLRLEAKDVLDDDEKINEIISLAKKTNGSGIIYFALIKSLEQFSEILYNEKIPHLIYHGRLPAKDRKVIQNSFMNGKDKLVLATNAFGMGVDKPDIRFVIHAEIPGCIESYYQEIGRAGRDGKPSTCVLLYNQDDIMIHMDFIRWSNPEPNFYIQLFDVLENDIESINSFGIDSLREKLVYKNRKDFRLETALGMFERYSVIEGSVQHKDLRLIGELPSQLIDEERFEEKILNDRKKLLSIVEYFRKEQCRRISIEEYFGFMNEQPCGNCDNC